TRIRQARGLRCRNGSMGPPRARFQGVGKTSCDSAGLGRANECLPAARRSEQDQATGRKTSKAKVDAKAFDEVDNNKLLLRLNEENRFQTPNSFPRMLQNALDHAAGRAADIVHFHNSSGLVELRLRHGDARLLEIDLAN